MTEHSRLAGQTLWDLIDARVAATPDAVLAVAETGRRVTFAEYAEAAERAAAGFAAMGIGEGSVVTWQLPTWIESLVLVAALSRLGAVQNPVLPIYREREVAFVTAQASARLLVVPSEWRGFDFEAMATPIAAANDGCSVLASIANSDGDPADAGRPVGRRIRWLFTPPARRPTRRVPPHRRLDRCGRGRNGRSDGLQRGRPQRASCSCLPTSVVSPGCSPPSSSATR
jgi:acyl-coenzyme A synthetase/AMP-(fatty) acid ligase